MKIPFWATLFTVLSVAILCSLGAWQLQRLAWKNDIITKLDEAYDGNVEPLVFNNMKESDFTYGIIAGQFLFDKALLLGHSIKDGIPGKSLIVPLKTDQGTLLVNLGWNANNQSLENHNLQNFNNQTIRFTGLVRKPGWNAFTPQNDPKNNIWYRPDINEIANVKELSKIVPFMLYADTASKDLGNAFPNNERWQPNNNHAQYAFFWFTLAGALLIIYILRFFGKKQA